MTQAQGRQAFFQGGFVPLDGARVSVMTHAFIYGTGCFEEIRGYWNPAANQIYLFRILEGVTPVYGPSTLKPRYGRG